MKKFEHLDYLFVDLDGTLIHTDLMFESILLLLKKNPAMIFLFPLWLLKGKAWFKYNLGKRIAPFFLPESLPFNPVMIDHIQRFKEKENARVILASGSTYELVNKVAETSGLFDGVLASDKKINLIGKNKLKRMREMCDRDFLYAGDSRPDIKIWEETGYALIINSGKRKFRKLTRTPIEFTNMPADHRFFLSLAKQLRLHQWSKNLLIFLPPILSRSFFNIESILDTLWAFFAFSLAASAIYVVNDLLDLQEDRCHPKKKYRPLAEGSLKISTMLVVLPLLIFLSLGFTALLPVQFFFTLLFYLTLTVSYSFFFKKILILDMLALGLGYTMRILAGGAANDVDLTFWMLSWSVFFFFGLVAMKRLIELKQYNPEKSGRSYLKEDIPVIRTLGMASGFCSVLVFALYINEGKVGSFYEYPKLLWLILIILIYWLSRMWLFAERGKINSDPVEFVIKDIPSMLSMFFILILVLFALNVQSLGFL